MPGGRCGQEEAAFWMLCAITEQLLPEHYTSGMVGVRVDSSVLVDLLDAHPSLSAVTRILRDLDLDLSIVSTQWLLLAFLNAIPTDTTLRIWDLFFVSARAPSPALAAVVTFPYPTDSSVPPPPPPCLPPPSSQLSPFQAVGPRALLAASVAAVHLLQERLLSADGSFEEAYSILKDRLPSVALDDDLFVRRMLEALEALPTERLMQMRARHRGVGGSASQTRHLTHRHLTHRHLTHRHPRATAACDPPLSSCDPPLFPSPPLTPSRQSSLRMLSAHAGSRSARPALSSSGGGSCWLTSSRERAISRAEATKSRVAKRRSVPAGAGSTRAGSSRPTRHPSSAPCCSSPRRRCSC